MRVGNRINTVITEARMNRIAKTRIWTNNWNRKTTGGNATSSGYQSKGATSKSSNLLLQILNSMNSSMSTTGKKLAENQSKSYDYEMMRIAADRVETHMEKLLETGEGSMYAAEETETDREKLSREVLGFVSDYNLMLRKLNNSGSSADEGYAKKLKSQFSANQAALKNLGITQDSQGVLTMDLKIFTQAELSDIQKMLADEDGLSGKIKELAKEVSGYAKTQTDSLKKENDTLSGNYSRYGTDNGSTKTTGNWFSAKG